MGNTIDTRTSAGTNYTATTARVRLTPTASELMAERLNCLPVWARAPKSGLCPYTQLSRSDLYARAASGEIRTASLRKPGQTKGVRLFHVPSILAMIERHATGPVVESTQHSGKEVTQ